MYKKLLSEEIAFKSISTDTTHAKDIKGIISWLTDQFKKHTFHVEVIEGYGNPFIIATIISDPSLETCLVYGHYDVQPADREDGWKTDPFILTEKDNRLYGRGAMDNKGQHLVHMLTVFELLEKKRLSVNVTFLLEGNEESGSPHLARFISDYKKQLSCDVILISDGEITEGFPTIEVGFRGNISATIHIQTAESDLHSGLYGGAAPNAIHEACKFIDRFYDTNNTVTIPGFYDDVDIPSLPAIPFTMDHYTKNTTAKALLTRPGVDFYTQVGHLPSLEITGFQSGYTQEGYRNSIPAKALVKINIRLAGAQTPQQMERLLRTYASKIIPSYVSYTLTFAEGVLGTRLPRNNPYMTKAKRILKAVYGVDPLFRFVGGSLPIVTYFEKILKKPQLLIPLANEDGMMHGMNENFSLVHLQKAFAFSQKFFGKGKG